MDTHVKVIAALYAVLGGLCVVGAFFTNVLLKFVAGFVAASGEPDAEVGVAVLGFAGTALSAILIALAIPYLATAFGLWHFKPWARIAGIIVGVFSLFNPPFGTLLGAYALVILFRKDTESLFVQR